MQTLFVDTAAWIGLEVVNDQNHQAALQFRQRSGRTYRWVTTNWIIWETVTWLRRRVDHAAAVRFGERVLTSSRLDVVSVTSDHEASAWTIFRRYRDKDFGFVDCSSFAVMQALRIDVAFSFDTHFRQAGFPVLPEQFEG
jgi:predicted nucleic acid-binding protein